MNILFIYHNWRCEFLKYKRLLRVSIQLSSGVIKKIGDLVADIKSSFDDGVCDFDEFLKIEDIFDMKNKYLLKGKLTFIIDVRKFVPFR
jgi:hypothetical protein